MRSLPEVLELGLIGVEPPAASVQGSVRLSGQSLYFCLVLRELLLHAEQLLPQLFVFPDSGVAAIELIALDFLLHGLKNHIVLLNFLCELCVHSLDFQLFLDHVPWADGCRQPFFPMSLQQLRQLQLHPQ